MVRASFFVSVQLEEQIVDAETVSFDDNISILHLHVTDVEINLEQGFLLRFSELVERWVDLINCLSVERKT